MPWEQLETRLALDSTVVFSELMYHPRSSEELEWLELHNTMAVDMDLSQWRIEGVGYSFPDGTVLRAGQRLVVARSPGALQAATGLSGVYGPYSGQMDNAGERLQLVNNSDRIMDEVRYTDAFPWPVGADGSGASLAKIDADGGSGEPSNWTVSEQVGGTPGRENFVAGLRLGESIELVALDHAWRFDDRGIDYGSTWLSDSFDPDDPNGDGDPSDRWQSAAAPFASPAAEAGLNANTSISAETNTHYFRTEFTLDQDVATTILNLQLVVDDGAVVYLNGQEATRVNMPDGPIRFSTPAVNFVDRAEPTEVLTLPATHLQHGRNVLAVELHQAAPQDPTGGPGLPSSVMRISTREGYSLIWDGSDGRFFDPAAPPQGARVPPNAALASQRAVAFTSSELGAELGLTYHRTQNLNDGHYGNANSWIGGDTNSFAPVQFAGIRFPEPIFVQRIAWGRDNGNDATDACGGQCADRTTGTYTIQYTRVPQPDANTPDTNDAMTGWDSIGFVTYRSNEDAQPGGGFTNYLRHEYAVRLLGQPVQATGMRILVPKTGLADGTAIDEIEVYTAESILAPDAVFAASLSVVRIVDESKQLAFAEVAAAGAADFFVELVNASPDALDLGGYTLVTSDRATAGFTLPSIVAPPGAVLTFTSDQLGLRPRPGQRLFLFAPGGARLVDAVRVEDQPQARTPQYGTRWLVPRDPTPGSINRFGLEEDIVINEILYHAPGQASGHSGGGDIPSAEQWIELYNRSQSRTIDLSGWHLEDAVQFVFPPGATIGPGQYRVVARDPQAVRAKYPEIADTVLGPFEGILSNRTDTIRLLDGRGNPADEVRYYDAGRWPQFADGGGSSLELIDVLADNNVPESWAASDQRDLSTWQTVRYRATIAPDGFTNGVTNRYREFIFGLLDAGELLIDDVSVVEDPDGAAIQRIPNGTFTGDQPGTAPARWRIAGNHQAVVIDDPDEPGNRVLHLTASGALEDRLNHAEATLVDNAPIRNGTTYEIAWRAKWLSGSNQLNTHLYFDRAQKTTILPRPDRIGTPGRANSVARPNIGPTYDELQHNPIVPQPGQPVTVSVLPHDPQGVASSRLWYSVNGGTRQSVPMTGDTEGTYRGVIPGQARGDVVQFYIESADALGTASYFPAAGPESRAMYAIEDGQAREGIHNFRIIMTPEDTALLHQPTNAMSNARLGATVIYNQSQAYYDVGVRLKGSNAARTSSTYLGFNVEFDPMHLFRGVHDSVAIDRSGRSSATPNTQDEILIKHIANRAGQIPYMYDDLVRVIAPRRVDTRTALLMMARYGDVFLDSQFENGADGTVFKMDIAYVPNGTTSRDPESPKLPFPYSHPLPTRDLEDLGDDRERYRAHLLIRNNRAADDYRQIIAAAKALDQPTSNRREAASGLIDIDQWARVFALQSLTGAADTYTRGSLHHNLNFYVRPKDGKVVALPWDWDFAFTASASQSLIGTEGNAGRLMNQPGVRRLYHGHLLDIINTAFNNEYMDPWIDHYGQVAGQNLSPIKNYIRQRRSFVLRRLPAAIPFEITTNEGQDFTTADPSTLLAGRGWIDVRHLRVSETGQWLDVVWLDDQNWQATVPLTFGANRLTLEAFDHQGKMVGSDQITVTSTSSNPVVDSLRITEIHYHPADPTSREAAALPGVDAEDFEFLEFLNRGERTIQLSGVRLTRGVEFTFPSLELAPGERAVVVSNREAFAWRYGTSVSIAGVFQQGNLSNAGERITLVSALGEAVLDFSYDDQTPWPTTADSAGDALELIDPDLSVQRLGDGRAWRAAAPSPGTVSAAGGDFNRDGRLDAADIDLLAAAIRTGTPGPLDPDGDGQTTLSDHGFLIQRVLRTTHGDANLDVRFDSGDLVLVFQAGQYEDGLPGNSSWITGDFDGDGDFTSSDLVAAFKAGGYQVG